MTAVTVAWFDFLPQAEIARGRLAAEGIDAWLADQHLVQTDWLYSIAVGGIKVQVAEADAKRAREVLAKDWSEGLQ